MDDWQPYETAPTDGRKIIGWDEDKGAKETRFVDFPAESTAGQLYAQGHGKRGCFEYYDYHGNRVYEWRFTSWVPFPGAA